MVVENVLFNQINYLGIAIAEKLREKWGMKNLYAVVFEQDREDLIHSSFKFG